jgi:NADPH-dependent curcumin reductase CurA
LRVTLSREIRLASRPVGTPTRDHFDLQTVEVPPPGPGEVQVRNEWMSLDPSMRGRMYDAKSYVPPFEVGVAMEGRAVGHVVASNDPGFAPGDVVGSMLGWRESFTAPASALEKLDVTGMPPRAFLGIGGISGMTAYVGLLHMAALKPGDAVFVSAASGAVGSIVCQIAKLKGHKVIGSAGGPEKIAFLKDQLGVDEAIDYKAEPSLTKALARAAPEGIDVYFDNVGGTHLEAALSIANRFARFALCGMISTYNLTAPSPGPKNIMLAVTKNIRLQGFIVLNYPELKPAFLADVRDWHARGLLRQTDTVREGIEAAPDAFLDLFTGHHIGKMLVKLS